MKALALLATTVLVLSTSCGRVASGGDDDAASPTSVGQPSFLPETYAEGGSVVMSVTFPDGSTSELVYPTELDLANLHVQPYSSGFGPSFGRDFLVIYGPVEEVIGRYGDAELLAECEDGQGGTVGFWRLPPVGVYLALQFGSRTVLVYDYGTGEAQMSDEDRVLWATNLHGRDALDGFLLLDADPPLTLARAGEHAGPELEFWSRGGDGRGVLLFVGECGPDPPEVEVSLVGNTGWFASWCDRTGLMSVHVYGGEDRSFVETVLENLEVRNVTLAP